MNWYRFKTELTVWAIKVALSVFTALVLATTYQYMKLAPSDLVRWNPEDQFLGEYTWVAPAAVLVVVGLMWLMFLCAFRSMRSSARYGER